MFGSLHVALGALLLSFTPKPAQPAAAFSIQQGEVCSGLSEAECCVQMVELAGFRAHGDHLPRLVRNTVRLACGQAPHEVEEPTCGSLLTTFGFGAQHARSACASRELSTRCADDVTCAKCSEDLRKLDYARPERLCHAVTHLPPKAATGTVHVKKVFLIGKGGKVDTELHYRRGK